MSTGNEKENAAGLYTSVISKIEFLVRQIFDNIQNSLFVDADAVKYTILAICQLLLSAGLVMLLFRLTGFNETVLKIIVDCCLFVISYQIQREIVFK